MSDESLRAELDAARRREASFRVRMVQEFLHRGERNTTLHALLEERAALVKRAGEASADIAALTGKLEAEERDAALMDAELARARASAPLRALGRVFRAAPAPAPSAQAAPARAPGAAFTYFLHTSPFRIYRSPAFTLRGWAWPQDGAAVTGVRANVDGRLFVGRHGLAEPEVIALHGAQPANPMPGFEVTFETPAGRHVLGIEAEVAGSGWRTILCTTIWCEPDSE